MWSHQAAKDRDVETIENPFRNGDKSVLMNANIKVRN